THAALEKSSLSAKMVLQVHDELVFETPQAELQQLEALVRSSMESAVQMKVALKVDMGSGDNWLETK
ncbi:MAG TPA: DNA polymerase, partial [bacterium]|nr:DNA polymerase [bacterium]